MAINKTTETQLDVIDFVNALKDETKKTDSLELIKIFQKKSGFKPKLWGPSIIGFGSYHYKYESGHEGDAPLIAFSPRAAALTLYLCGNFDNREELLLEFGKHKTNKGCIYVKKLADIKLTILDKMITNHLLQMNKNNSK